MFEQIVIYQLNIRERELGYFVTHRAAFSLAFTSSSPVTNVHMVSFLTQQNKRILDLRSSDWLPYSTLVTPFCTGYPILHWLPHSALCPMRANSEFASTDKLF
jgi:hypothetical protein